MLRDPPAIPMTIHNRWADDRFATHDGRPAPDFIDYRPDRQQWLADDAAPRHRWKLYFSIALGIALLGLAAALYFGAKYGDFARLEKELSAARTQIPHLKSLLAAAEQKADSLTADLAAAKDQLDAALAKIAGLEKENAALKIKLKTHPAARSSLELDSCWSRPGLRTVPVYRITVQDEAFIIAPAWADAGESWPAAYQSKMGDLTPIAAGTTLDRQAFSTAMFPYYKRGVEPAMNCRFFVDVADATTNKESWKSGLAMVERYFYKELVP